MILTRLRGLAAGLAILAFVIGAPILLLRLGAVPSLDGFTWRDLLRQDDGTLALQALTAAAWIAWAWFAITILVEVVALARGVRAPRLPGLPQVSASRLVGAAALLFIAVPAAAPTIAPTRAVSAPPLPEPSSALVTTSPVQSEVTTGADTALTESASPPTVGYTVARGDSLWKIAETHLGGGERYPEIVALNPDVLDDDPDFLTPGIRLKLPAPAPAADDDETYVVRPGDTLAEIAADQLGDPDRYPEIYDASRATVQPDGAHLKDPDLIQPGWNLTVPAREQPHGATAPPDPAAPTAPPIRDRSHPTDPTQTPTLQPSDQHDTTAGDAEDVNEEGSPSWLLPGLAGAGTVLAGALFLVLRRSHRTRRRYRLPGQEIAPPPEEVAPAAMSIHRTGRKPADLIEHLDLLLRALREAEQPHLLAAELADTSITLHLAEPGSLPRPWTGGPITWTARPDSTVEDNGETAPYPLLVSIGQGADGHLWLLNLEEVRVLNIAGNQERGRALARHLAAELAVTPWSALVEVHTHGIADELDGLDPIRLHLHPAGDVQHLEQLAVDLDPAERLPGFAPDRYRAIILTKDTEPGRRIAHTITNDHDRSGAAAVILDAHPDLEAESLTITATGDLTVSHPMLSDVRLKAAGITAEEAAMCAAIAEATRTAESKPMPVDEDATEGMDALIDAAGALRPEYVHERPTDDKPAGASSLLPAPAEEYVAAASTTKEDVRQLAPVVPPPTRDKMRTLKPDRIDDVLAEWHSPDCRFPKLILLGDVHIQAHGVPPEERPSYLAELLTYLVLHPGGVTTGDYIEATGISRSRLRADISHLRAWLGTNPRTGREHLPDARQTRAAKRIGRPAYQAEDVLVDLEIFRALRARAQTRGEGGIADLSEALGLVAGKPFTQDRDHGWEWLHRGQPHDQIAVSMIVDTAHLVVTRALAEGDLDTARSAAETATLAAPYDDVPELDYAQVLAASGHIRLAEQHLARHIHDRDDGNGPIDPPRRTKRAG